MSDTKFTKGPWAYHLDDTVRNKDSSKIMAKVVNTMIVATDEDKANGHLIACAPEMYNMLELLLNNDSINDHTIDSEVARLLAKARGEHDTNS